jgi:hypothetical protein
MQWLCQNVSMENVNKINMLQIGREVMVQGIVPEIDAGNVTY